jgi:hypothetical protein
MWPRIFINALLILTSTSVPFWFTVTVFIVFAFLFSKPIEIIIFAVLLDILFSAQSQGLLIPFYTIVASIFYIVSETLRPRLR